MKNLRFKKLMWTKIFSFKTKEKVNKDDHYGYKLGTTFAAFKRIEIEVGVNLHSIYLLPSFHIFWRGGYWSVSLDFLCVGFAVMVEDDHRVIVEEGGEE